MVNIYAKVLPVKHGESNHNDKLLKENREEEPLCNSISIY